MKLYRKLLALALAFVMILPAAAAEEDNVRIAVIDSGISTQAIDSASIIPGKNYLFPEASTEDLIGHGTAIASILVGSESAGITGICPSAELVPLIFLSNDADGWTESGDSDDLAVMIRDAVDIYDCDIINISMTSRKPTDALADAVAYAAEKGVLIVAAAGNSGNLITYYPGGYDSVLCVGSVNPEGTSYADFSNRNSALDLLAPGVDVTLANIDGTSKIDSGTSFSTGYVTGYAANLMLKYPNLSADQIKQILCASARDLLAAGYDYETGWGVLNVHSAMTYARQGRQFRDAASNEWFFEGVKFASAAGLMKGTDAVTFSPQQTTTRAMMWVMLHRMAGQKETANAAAWYSDAQKWVKDNGIADGRDPNKVITREEIACMVYEFARYSGHDITNAKNFDISGYSDYKTVSKNAVSAMRWVCAEGIINGMDGALCPTGNATRAQIATILMRFHSVIEK